MNKLSVVLTGGLLAFTALASDAAITVAPSAPIQAAVADPSRPEHDRARDPDRKPVETLQFTGIKPGDLVADYAAGNGYFTRLFAGVVEPTGHVYAVVPSALYQYPNIVTGTADIQRFAAEHPNVTVTFAAALAGLKFPQRLDLFWISQNYHDLHDRFMGPVDMSAFNRAVFAALRPGGCYVVLDHSAAAGASPDVTETLHRIDPSVVRREVEAAGFKFEAQSTVLANPADPRTASVFDDSIRGHTDQFILKFRRP